MRLADAMRELDGVNGPLRMHRSWWVAKSGVKDVRREGGSAQSRARLRQGSARLRTYMAAVKEVEASRLKAAFRKVGTGFRENAATIQETWNIGLIQKISPMF